MKFLNKKAQSTAEYAIIIALVIGAAVAMQLYVRRGLSGGIKYATDNLSSGPDAQYEPYYLMSDAKTTRQNIASSEEFIASGKVERKTGLAGDGELTTRTSKQKTRTTADKD